VGLKRQFRKGKRRQVAEKNLEESRYLGEKDGKKKVQPERGETALAEGEDAKWTRRNFPGSTLKLYMPKKRRGLHQNERRGGRKASLRNNTRGRAPAGP